MYLNANATSAYQPHSLNTGLMNVSRMGATGHMGMGTNQALMLLKTLHACLSQVCGNMSFDDTSFSSWPCGSGHGGHHGGHGHGHHGHCGSDDPATVGRWRLDMLGCDKDINNDDQYDYIELYEDGTAKLKTVGPDGCLKTDDDSELDAEMYADDLEHLPPFLRKALGFDDDDHNCPHHCDDQGGWGWFPDMPMHGYGQGYGQGYGVPGMGGYMPSGQVNADGIVSNIFASTFGSGGFGGGYGMGSPMGFDQYNMTGGIFTNRRGTDYNIYTPETTRNAHTTNITTQRGVCRWAGKLNRPAVTDR